MTRNDAIAIIQKFFRDPIYNEGSRKYRFRIEGLSKSSVSDLHCELYRNGSDIKLNEILAFIDQDYLDNPIQYLHLPLRFLLPGELLRIVHQDKEEILKPMNCMKLSSTHCLVWMEGDGKNDSIVEGIVNVESDAIIGEQIDSPFIDSAKIISVTLLAPPIQYRYLDHILLTEDYPETNQTTAFKLYSILLEAHVANIVIEKWKSILEVASGSGISTYSIFKILEYLCKNEY